MFAGLVTGYLLPHADHLVYSFIDTIARNFLFLLSSAVWVFAAYQLLRLSTTMTTFGNFDATTRAEDVVSSFAMEIKNKTFLITGVSPNSLGGHIAQSIAAKHPRLLILSGHTRSGVQAVTELIAETGFNVPFRILEMDLASFDSVKAAAEEVNGYDEESIDVLINNAGVTNIPRRELSRDGFELHLAINYLGPFLFTTSIMGKITPRAQGRIVNVGSDGYAFSPFRFADYNFDGDKELPDSEHPPREPCTQLGIPWTLQYSPMIAYGQSKAAVLLFTHQLAHMMISQEISVVAVHPGDVAANPGRHMQRDTTKQVPKAKVMKTLAQAASTVLVAALDPLVAGLSGSCLADCQVHEVEEFARDENNAARLWDLTSELIS